MAALPAEPDAELVARCRGGDAGAWAALVSRYQRLVYAIVMRAGHDEHQAADVFQTVFTRLLQHLPRLQQPERLQAWIVTTAKREALLARRLGQRTLSMSADEGDDGREGAYGQIADSAPLAEDALSELQQLHRLRQALDRLEQRCRELLTMIFADDDDKLPYEAVALKLNMPVGSIGPTRARCLRKLRDLVESLPTPTPTPPASP